MKKMKMEPNKEKRDLNFIISSTMSSISVTKETIADLTRKLTIEQEQLQKLEDKLTDATAKLKIFESSSSGGTRKKTLNKNNRKTRTLCKKNNNI
jgi:cell division protein FtsL